MKGRVPAEGTYQRVKEGASLTRSGREGGSLEPGAKKRVFFINVMKIKQGGTAGLASRPCSVLAAGLRGFRFCIVLRKGVKKQ